jgi:peptide/nickel transport system permease protein
MPSAGARLAGRRGRWRAAGALVVIAIVAMAVAAPVLPLPDPNRTQPSRRLAAPLTSGYPLGSDHLGRDLLSRVIWGARVSLMVGVLATLLAMIAGTTLGLITGFYGGVTDNIVMRGIDLVMAFPYILLAMLLVAALGPGLVNAMIAVAVVNVSFYARGVRAAVLLLREQEFVEAARAIGSASCAGTCCPASSGPSWCSCR